MAKLSVATTGLNAQVKTIAERIPISQINVSEVFSNLISIKTEDLDLITSDMKENGFDPTKPLIIWKEENILIDGHTRFAAAKKAELAEVYGIYKSFDSEDEAIADALKQQLCRRNCSSGELLMIIDRFDSLKTKGILGTTLKGKSSEALAKHLGVSAKTVERARVVIKNADEDLLEAVKKGEASISAAAKRAKPSVPKPPVPIIEEENDTAIEPAVEEEELGEDSCIEEFSIQYDEEPYSSKITLYEEITNFNIHHLAIFLNQIQKDFLLSTAEWEERLQERI